MVVYIILWGFPLKKAHLPPPRARINSGRRNFQLAHAKSPNLDQHNDGKLRAATDILSTWPGYLKALELAIPELAEICCDPVIRSRLLVEVKYRRLIQRQDVEISSMRAMENMVLPEDFDYKGLVTLKREVMERLESVRPATLGAAARLEGVTPAAITQLLQHVRR